MEEKKAGDMDERLYIVALSLKESVGYHQLSWLKPSFKPLKILSLQAFYANLFSELKTLQI